MSEFSGSLHFDLNARDVDDADRLLRILASRLSDIAPGTVAGNVVYEFAADKPITGVVFAPPAGKKKEKR